MMEGTNIRSGDFLYGKVAQAGLDAFIDQAFHFPLGGGPIPYINVIRKVAIG